MFGNDPKANRLKIQESLLVTRRLLLPPGEICVDDGLVLPAETQLEGSVDGKGAPTTVLRLEGPGSAPLLHVRGSDVEIANLRLEPSMADSGPHGGHRNTGITVGDYIYHSLPCAVRRVRIANVAVHREAPCASTSICIIGDVADIEIDDVLVTGGGSGVGLHWGARGRSVSEFRPPTLHPHRVSVRGLRVFNAREGWYLSSVYDTRFQGCAAHEVEIGFRVLAGDNTDRFHRQHGQLVGSQIAIENCQISWHGPLYGLRIAGWGRSEIDGVITTLAYKDMLIQDLTIETLPLRVTPRRDRERTPIVLESVESITWRNLAVTGLPGPLVSVSSGLRDNLV